MLVLLVCLGMATMFWRVTPAAFTAGTIGSETLLRTNVELLGGKLSWKLPYLNPTTLQIHPQEVVYALQMFFCPIREPRALWP